MSISAKQQRNFELFSAQMEDDRLYTSSELKEMLTRVLPRNYQPKHINTVNNAMRWGSRMGLVSVWKTQRRGFVYRIQRSENR